MPKEGEALKMLVFAPHVSGMGVAWECTPSSLGSGHYNEAFVPKYGDLVQFQAA